MAVAVGTYILNSAGSASTGDVSFGRISVQDSHAAVTQSNFLKCSALSLTDSSQGSSSVYGGALALLHSPQVSYFKLGLLQPLSQDNELKAAGFNLTVLISKSNFFLCSAFSSASSVRPGKGNGGGGATYAKSVAMNNFSVTTSTPRGGRLTGAVGPGPSSLSVLTGVRSSTPLGAGRPPASRSG